MGCGVGGGGISGDGGAGGDDCDGDDIVATASAWNISPLTG